MFHAVLDVGWIDDPGPFIGACSPEPFRGRVTGGASLAVKGSSNFLQFLFFGPIMVTC